MRSADTLGRLLDLIPAAAGERWLDAACGPGLVARGLAARVGEVHGVDMTPAMVDARPARGGGARGSRNASFAVGDATALDVRAGTASTAPSPASACTTSPAPAASSPSSPGSCGPAVRSSWPTTSPSADADVAAWHEEIERLRDPSHWACLTPARLRALGERAGLVLERERRAPLSIDFEEWIARGSGGAAHAA